MTTIHHVPSTTLVPGDMIPLNGARRNRAKVRWQHDGVVLTEDGALLDLRGSTVGRFERAEDRVDS